MTIMLRKILLIIISPLLFIYEEPRSFITKL